MNNPYKTIIGKGFGKGTEPKFKLFSGITNPHDLTVAQYGIVMRDGMPKLEIVKVHSVLDILYDVIDSYAEGCAE